MPPPESVSQRDFAALEKRVGAIEARIERDTNTINRALDNAKGGEDRIDKKVGELETRLRRDIKALTRDREVVLDVEKQLLQKVSEMDKTGENRVTSINKALANAKSYDEKLEQMINDLRAKIDRLSR